MLLSSAHSYNSTGSLVSVVNNRFALDTSNYNYWVYNSQPFVSTAYTVDDIDRRRRASREDGGLNLVGFVGDRTRRDQMCIDDFGICLTSLK